MLGGGDFEDEDRFETEKKELLLAEPRPDRLRFPLPPHGIDAKTFVETHFGPHSQAKNLQFRKGTTTLAFVYEGKTEQDTGGIIVAVDSRASAGEYISSKSVMKILDISDRMVATMAGGAADCQFWTRIVAKYCTLFELREKSEITVSAASKYFANVLFNYRGMGLSVVCAIVPQWGTLQGSMISGYDKRGPSIFMVDSDGTRVPLKVCSVGSGSLAAYGVLDTFYQPKMSDEEARRLGRRAIMHATYRDSGSGGVVNMVHITPTAKIRFPSMDVSELFYEFAAEIGRDIVYDPVDDC